MKNLLTFTACLLWAVLAWAQSTPDTVRFKQWLDKNTARVRSIQPNDEDYSDLQSLKQIVGNARIVMLGEETHGDGATFLAKTRVLKYLHKEMGFDMIVFENGIYDLYKANKEIQSGTSVDVALRNSLYPVWTDSKEFQPLIEYLEQQRQNGKPLTIAGLDPYQNGTYTPETLIDDLSGFLRRRVPELFNDSLLFELDEVVSEMGSLPKTPDLVLGNNMSVENVTPNLFNNLRDSSLYFAHSDKIFEALKIVPNLYPGQKADVLYWTQILTSINKCIQIELDTKRGIEHPAQNPRDWIMAKNLMFFEKQFPDKKIIVWGANYHMLNNVESIKYKQLKTAYPMGEIINQVGDNGRICTIAFTAAKGKYGWVSVPPRELLPPPPGSIELDLMNMNIPYGLVNLKSDTAKFRYYCSALYYVPIKGNWANVYDGLFYIRDMTSATPARRNDEADTRIVIDKAIPIQGIVRDAKTKQPIAYATVSIVGTPNGTVTNQKGNFELKIPLGKADEILQVASLGYQTVQYSVLEKIMNEPFVEVDMKAQDYTLEQQEIFTEGKTLTPEKIMRRASRRLNKNYMHNAFSTDIFYRGWRKDNSNQTYQLEAALDLYDSKGNKRSDLRGLLRERNFRINQIRRVNYSDFQGRVQEYLADMSQQDIVRSKNNLLSLMRLRYYDLELEDVTYFDDAEVFIIKYKCNKPTFYTTGHNDVDTYEGRIYVKRTDYSIVKNETKIGFRVNTASVGGRQTQLDRTVEFTTIYRKFGDYYFQNYSKQRVEITQSNALKKTPIASEKLLVEMLVTNIQVDNPEVFKGRINDISLERVQYNKEFWDNFTVMLEAVNEW